MSITRLRVPFIYEDRLKVFGKGAERPFFKKVFPHSANKNPTNPTKIKNK
jgi:hypothetical protein